MISKLLQQMIDQKNSTISVLARDVLKAVAKRGYRRGWRRWAFIARQLCKAVEELSEASCLMINGSGSRLWQTKLKEAARDARSSFDDNEIGSWWEDYTVNGKHEFAVEFADIMIPLLAAYAELEEEGIDMEAIIREKVIGDIDRGVR